MCPDQLQKALSGDGEMEAQGSAVSKIAWVIQVQPSLRTLSEVEERAASGNNILSTAPGPPNQRLQPYPVNLGG